MAGEPGAPLNLAVSVGRTKALLGAIPSESAGVYGGAAIPGGRVHTVQGSRWAGATALAAALRLPGARYDVV